MTTSQFASPSFTSHAKYSDPLDWSRKSDTLRSNIGPSVFDPAMLNDLAEGLAFLHRQLDKPEAKLDRSREQGRTFERDARLWENEAARLREEADATRRSLDELRQEFEQSRESSHQSQETLRCLAEEMAEMRAARAHLETLAAEQQRALVLSLELLKRSNPEHATGPSAEAPVLVDLQVQNQNQDQDKDREIADLKRMIEAAGEEGSRVDAELAATRAELESRMASHEAELIALRAELQNTRSELAATQEQLKAARTALGNSETALEAAQEELRCLMENPPNTRETGGGVEEEKAELAQKLRDAEAEVAIQNAEIESRGAIIVALENALEEQNTSLRTLEERFLTFAEQVQALQLQRLEMPAGGARGIASRFAKIFAPPKRSKK